MTETLSPKINQTWKFLQDQVAPLLVLVYSVLVLVCFVFLPVLFVISVRTPFLGAFVEHTLMVNTVSPTRPGTWELNKLKLDFGYQIQQIDGVKISSVQNLRSVLGGYQPGDTISLTLLTPEGQLQSYPVQLQRLPGLDQLSFFVIPYIVGLVYLISGLYVFGVRRYEAAGRSFSLFSSSVAIALAGLYDGYSTGVLVPIWTVSLAMAGAAMLNLAVVFPEVTRPVQRRPYLSWLGYLLAIPIAIYGVSTIYNFNHPTAYVLAWRVEFIFMALAAIIFLVMVGLSRSRSGSPIIREQSRLIFWGALIAFSPIVAWFLVTTSNPQIGFSSYLMLPLGIFPVLTAYALIRYRLLSTDYLLSRTVLYAFLTVIAVAGYGLLVTGLSQILGVVLSPTNPLLIGLMVFILAVTFNPLRMTLQNRIDQVFFRGQVAYRERQQAFGRELTRAMELNEIVGVLRQYIDQALMPSQLHIFVFDSASGHYLTTPDVQGRPTSDIRFPLNSALVQALSRQREAIFLSSLDNLPAALQPEQARLALLGVQLFVPLPGRQQLIGWIALGLRLSGEPYNSRDLIFLEVLSDQAALAVERAQVVIDLERRIRETTVLTRVSQGVSFTMAFDDILELISAQTGQLMPARDLWVTLYNKETEILSHVFFLQDDDRLTELENRSLPNGQGLEWVVLTDQRPLMTDDYESECHGRGLLPGHQGIYAWMGVPLNAGAETIGLLSVASRDPALIYTSEQRDLLQAIADQTSGAIVKARLLEESERRARQLGMLNEIGMGLTSTLDLRLLLKRILDSATDILNCEAGSLFMVDPQTDEMVFEVVISPVAVNLQGRRLPAGTGLVGQSVQTGMPMIVNDAKRRKEWFDKTDQQTGFDTQDLLVVPMRVQDHVIGAIEVINKRNGAPFTETDQDLLTAFTSQASIAVENARLYTMTDQALEARVEELSVMQRIDRELNASLDIERAMRITLDWAMRQSAGEAGLVGMVEKEGLRVMLAQGYPELVAAAQISESGAQGNGNPHFLPLTAPGLKDVLQGGLPRCLTVAAADTASEEASALAFDLLPDSRMQIVIPIRRETETIGLLLVESTRTDSCSDDLINFLMRLSDHAAIAISNAQLYEEVKEANLAKSRFVSFVAHELKNPMASIKGYTELVSGGMAGPVNEMQSSFLATVRSNVDRMNTIVSDLNDLTKIQVGNLRLDFKSVRMSDVLEEVIRSLKRQIEDKEQQYQVVWPDDLPMVWADPSRLNQILINLISNAIKYTPQAGQFTVGAERYKSEEEALAGAEFVHLWVKDTGIGIAVEDQKKVFQQYFRTDVAKEMASGTGLGLNITKSLVEMQGGRIWFESEPDEGTTFHFTVPVAETQ
jgi:signal transduction histidine kinase